MRGILSTHLAKKLRLGVLEIVIGAFSVKVKRPAEFVSVTETFRLLLLEIRGVSVKGLIGFSVLVSKRSCKNFGIGVFALIAGLRFCQRPYSRQTADRIPAAASPSIKPNRLR